VRVHERHEGAQAAVHLALGLERRFGLNAAPARASPLAVRCTMSFARSTAPRCRATRPYFSSIRTKSIFSFSEILLGFFCECVTVLFQKALDSGVAELVEPDLEP
jgi:hypothetical protein